jgi:hypothetical protein
MIRSVSPGIKVEFRYPADKYRLSFSNEVGLEFSKLGLREYIKLGTQSHENKYTFTAKNFYYHPSVRISYPVSFIRLGLFAGYLIDLKKESLSGSDGYLILSEGNHARSDWSGIRAGLSLSLSIGHLLNKNL